METPSTHGGGDAGASRDEEGEAPAKSPQTGSAPQDIAEPGDNDFLLGKGRRRHPGNERFRALTEDQKIKHFSSKATGEELPKVAMEIIREWRAQDPPGRFLAYNEGKKLWHDIGDKRMRVKVGQMLRDSITYDEGGAIVGECAEVKEGVFTEEEKKTMTDAQENLGNKWTEIAKLVPGRSVIQVKNWWHNRIKSQKRKRQRDQNYEEEVQEILANGSEKQVGSREQPEERWEERERTTPLNVPLNDNGMTYEQVMHMMSLHQPIAMQLGNGMTYQQMTSTIEMQKQSIFQKDQQIAAMNNMHTQTITEKDQQIMTLKQMIAEKDSQIQHLKNTVVTIRAKGKDRRAISKKAERKGEKEGKKPEFVEI